MDEVVVVTITRTIGVESDHVWIDTDGQPDLIEVLGLLEMAKALVLENQGSDVLFPPEGIDGE